MITNEMIQDALEKVPGFQLVDRSYGKSENCGCVFTLLCLADNPKLIFSTLPTRANYVVEWAKAKFGSIFVHWFINGFDNRPYIGICAEHYIPYNNGQEIRQQWKPISGLIPTSDMA